MPNVCLRKVLRSLLLVVALSSALACVRSRGIEFINKAATLKVGESWGEEGTLHDAERDHFAVTDGPDYVINGYPHHSPKEVPERAVRFALTEFAKIPPADAGLDRMVVALQKGLREKGSATLRYVDVSKVVRAIILYHDELKKVGVYVIIDNDTAHQYAIEIAADVQKP